MEDALSRPKVFRALVALRRSEPESLTMGAFMKAVGYYSEEAQELRQDLVDWGLITVEEAHHGQRPFLKIALTPEGQRMADAAIEAEAWAEKARERTPKRRGTRGA